MTCSVVILIWIVLVLVIEGRKQHTTLNTLDLIVLIVGSLVICAIWIGFWQIVWAIFFPLKHLWRDNPIVVYFLFFLLTAAYSGLRAGVRAYKQRRK
jgi:hypothetical protein